MGHHAREEEDFADAVIYKINASGKNNINGVDDEAKDKGSNPDSRGTNHTGNCEKKIGGSDQPTRPCTSPKAPKQVQTKAASSQKEQGKDKKVVAVDQGAMIIVKTEPASSAIARPAKPGPAKSKPAKRRLACTNCAELDSLARMRNLSVAGAMRSYGLNFIPRSRRRPGGCVICGKIGRDVKHRVDFVEEEVRWKIRSLRFKVLVRSQGHVYRGKSILEYNVSICLFAFASTQ